MDDNIPNDVPKEMSGTPDQTGNAPKGPKPAGALGALNRIIKKKSVIILIVIVAGAIIVAKSGFKVKEIFTKPKKAVETAAEAPEAAPVKVYKVKTMDFTDILPALGTIKGFREIDLKFAVAGTIESFNFNEGEEVREGDIIASLNQRDAILKLKYSEIELEKNKKLFEVGAIAKPKADQAKLEYESAKSDFDKTNIYAISNGLLGKQFKQVGDYVTPSDKVGAFIDTANVYAEFGIIERDISKIKLNQKAEVFADAYPGNSYNGTMTIIAPMVEGKSKTLTVKVQLKNANGELKPGMFARANIHTYEKQKAVIIPVSALQTKEEVQFVYIVHKTSGPKQGQPTEGAVEKTQPDAGQPPAEAAAEAPKPSGLFGKLKGLISLKKKAEAGKEAALAPEEIAETGEVEMRKVKVAYASPEAIEIEEGVKEGDLVIIELEGQELQDKAKVEITETRENLM